MPRGLAYTGYILALIGGIILTITGLLGLLGIPVTFPMRIVIENIRALERDTFTLILGIIATIGARYVDYLGWAIGLIAIGIIASGLGGALILVGGILGLVHRLNKPRG